MVRDHTSDRQLVERLREGDAKAVPELQTAYGARIYQLAFRYMKNHEDAEEVMQDVLLRVFRKIDAFRGDGSHIGETGGFPRDAEPDVGAGVDAAATAPDHGVTNGGADPTNGRADPDGCGCASSRRRTSIATGLLGMVATLLR